MKEITAVIRMNMVNKTKEALAEAGIPAFFALEAQEKGYEEAAELSGEKGRLYPKRVFSVIVTDDQVEDVVETIIDVNKTGKPGDGKIFVCPVFDSVRVRTGEKGNKSID